MLDLDEIARQGARGMLAEALEAEVQDYLDATRGERDEQGHALVVRNGQANEREVLLGAGSVALGAPRVHDRRVDEDGNRKRFKSVFAPVRARTDVSKGPGSRRAGLATIFKSMEAAEGRWRKLTGSHLVALVRAGAEFKDGELVEGSERKKAAA